MSDAPLKVQLALQGGGAKIVGLLAAMETVELLEKQKRIQVTRLAGTSAGAIIACLYAAGVPMGELRVSLCEGLGRQVLEHFDKPGIEALTKLLWNRRPIWDPTPIRDFLRAQLQNRGKTKLGQLKPPVLVTSSDVAGSRRVVHEDNESIVEALMCSSGIPFAFRVWDDRKDAATYDREDPLLVDGGICENLPVGELLRGEEKFGQVVAITFANSRYSRPTNLFGFAKSLLDTAIDNSVHRARATLPASSLFEIGDSFPISTFDFEEAIEVAIDHAQKDGPYAKVKAAAEAFFDGYIQRKTEGNPATNFDPWASGNAVVDKLLFAAWEMCFSLSRSKVQYESVEMEAVIHGNGTPDESHLTTVFRVLDEPLHCIKVSVMNPVAQAYLGRTWWSLFDKDGKEIQPIVVPIKDPRNPGDRWVALHFSPPLPPESGPYEFSISDHLDCVLDKLDSTGEDELFFETSRTRGSAEEMTFVVIHPRAMKLEVAAHTRTRCLEDRQLTPREVRDYKKRATIDRYTASGMVLTKVDGSRGGILIRKA